MILIPPARRRMGIRIMIPHEDVDQWMNGLYAIARVQSQADWSLGRTANLELVGSEETIPGWVLAFLIS